MKADEKFFEKYQRKRENFWCNSTKLFWKGGIVYPCRAYWYAVFRWSVKERSYEKMLNGLVRYGKYAFALALAICSLDASATAVFESFVQIFKYVVI